MLDLQDYYYIQKCHFAQPSATYLACYISPGTTPRPMQNNGCSRLSHPHISRQFLGLTSYYHRFVANFSKIAGPLHALTRQNIPFKWTPQCQCALEQLKVQLTQPPVLAYPNFDIPFSLHTDASKEQYWNKNMQDNLTQLHMLAVHCPNQRGVGTASL